MTNPSPAQQAHLPFPVSKPGTNTLATIALVFAFLFPLIGVICGHIALGQIKRTGEGGRGLAIAALIIGYVFIAFVALTAVLVVIGSLAEASASY